jgi:hypothetical protein
MLGSSKTGAVRAFVTASPARSRDADIYRHYAAGLYRQALLTRRDPVLAEHVTCDVIVNERALARMPERGEDDARYRPSAWFRAFRRPRVRLAGGLGSVRAGGLGHVRAGGAAAIHPRDMAALLYAVMRRPASSSAAVADDGSQVRRPATGGQ